MTLSHLGSSASAQIGYGRRAGLSATGERVPIVAKSATAAAISGGSGSLSQSDDARRDELSVGGWTSSTLRRPTTLGPAHFRFRRPVDQIYRPAGRDDSQNQILPARRQQKPSRCRQQIHFVRTHDHLRHVTDGRAGHARRYQHFDQKQTTHLLFVRLLSQFCAALNLSRLTRQGT